MNLRSLMILLVATLGCRSFSFKGENDASTIKADPSSGDQQIMSATDVARIKAALPKFAYQGLTDILNNPNTMWYSHKEITPSYQDSVGDGTSAPIGARPNSKAEGIIVPEGKHLFTGSKWTFPFGVTAGTDKSDNTEIANFLYLPTDGGKKLPVVYWIEVNKRHLGIEDTKWKWMYPKGTMLGELIFIKDASGAIYLTELRTRTRYLDGWATNAYRPFDTAVKLSEAIKAKRPNYAQSASLKAAVASLEGTSLKPLSLNSTAFPGVFTQSGYLDDIPDFGDVELTKDLLKNTVFVSTYKTAWKQADGNKAFAPTTTSGFSITPRNNQSGIIEVSETSCMRCHKDSGRAINEFVPQAVLYGDIWGEDGIFSFHPYDESRYPTFNTENRSVRPEFSRMGAVEKYDSSKHPTSFYKTIFQN